MNNITIYDIAKVFGVNPSTVNRALNGKPGVGEKKRKLIIKYAEKAGYTVNTAAKSLNRQMKIGLVMMQTVSVFDQQVLRGIKAASKELEGFNVMLHSYIVDNNHDYIHAFDSLQEAGCNGVLTLPKHDNEAVKVYKRLDEQDIAVAAIISDIRPINRLFAVHLDGNTTGRIAAELLEWFTGGGRVAFFTGDLEYVIHSDILHGFQSFANNSTISIADIYQDDADTELARVNCRHMLSDHKDIKGIFVSTANSVPICEEIIAAGKQGCIKIVCMDVFKDIVSLINSGIINASLYQQPYNQGYLAFWNMYKYLDGHTSQKDIIIQPQIVLKSNVDTFNIH